MSSVFTSKACPNTEIESFCAKQTASLIFWSRILLLFNYLNQFDQLIDSLHIAELWLSNVTTWATLESVLHIVFISNLPIWCLHVIHQSSAFLSNRRERYSCWHSRPRPWRRRVLDPLLCVEQSPKRVVKKSRLSAIRKIYCVLNFWQTNGNFVLCYFICSRYFFLEQIFDPTYDKRTFKDIPFSINTDFERRPANSEVVVGYKTVSFLYYSIHNSVL